MLIEFFIADDDEDDDDDGVRVVVVVVIGFVITGGGLKGIEGCGGLSGVGIETDDGGGTGNG